jgi:hypothetical protein
MFCRKNFYAVSNAQKHFLLGNRTIADLFGNSDTFFACLPRNCFDKRKTRGKQGFARVQAVPAGPAPWIGQCCPDTMS